MCLSSASYVQMKPSAKRKTYLIPQKTECLSIRHIYFKVPENAAK